MSSPERPDRRLSRTKKSSRTKSARPAKRATKLGAPNQAAAPSPRRLIVGIGASAGGLQAFKTFFARMPADTGMAFVLVQHLDPQHRSMLVELLSSVTTMPVIEATDGRSVAENHVYVIPPNATLRIAGGKLRVSKPAPAREHRHPVDTFFSALADDQGENAVCIVLSGGGSDGTEGLRAIKHHGGVTMAQAAFDEHAMSGMPKSAAATGLVDYVLAIEEMPAKLAAYSRHMQAIESSGGSGETRGDAGDQLAKICSLLRSKLGHDFSQYKEKTLTRRIQRRMQVLQIDDASIYVDRLRTEPQEIELLFHELLIGVTDFFRDPPAFEALATQVIPHLIHNSNADDIIRVWVPACATGEEVYSIAILLKEAAVERDARVKFQIFATDIDEHAIGIARAARYRDSQLADMPVERRERWFATDGDRWCPVKEIRELCIFSTHSVAKDPPFSKLDLISCRNLLIYLDPALQERLIRAFHYALRPGRYLFLGTSEGVTRQSKLFATLDQKHRIFQRRDVPAFLPNVPSDAGKGGVASTPDRSAPPPENGIERSARRLMEKHAPAYVVVDGNHDVLRFSGQTEKYLGPTPGAASLNLFTLIRRGLRPAARAALAKAMATGQSATHEGLAIEINGRRQFVDLLVEPIPDSSAGLCVVAFLDHGQEAAPNGSEEAVPTLPVEVLERELRTTRERLETTIDQLEISNEELKSANEEYQSVNEELQSTNEELETSKEEMQSINEELQTVNAELNSKNDKLQHVNSDLKNLLDSTQIATLFLDRQLRIKSFTPTMTDLFHLRDSDRGRPVTEIASRLSYDDLRKDAARVIRDLSVIERLVRTPEDGLSFLMRIRPYRTVDNIIDGVVISFIDVSDRARYEEERATLAAIVDSSGDAIISKDLDGIIISWNRGAEQLFGYTAEDVVGQPVTILIPPEQNNEESMILDRIRHGQHIDHYETIRLRKDGSQVAISLTVSPIRNAQGKIVGASKIARDITATKQAEAALRESEQRFHTMSDNIAQLAWICDRLGDVMWYNQRWLDYTGLTFEEMKDWGWKQVQHPDHVDRVVASVTHSRNTGEIWEDTFPLRGKDGNYRWFLSRAVPIRDTAGNVVRWFGTNTDISDLRDAEARQQLLVDELNHRVKNTLAAVQSIAAQSLKDGLDAERRKVFEERLIALARTHDLLSRRSWESAPLRDVLLQELSPYGSEKGVRFAIEGPDLLLNPKASLALGMAFHELATNAAKYGAFSIPTGQIRVAWKILSASEPTAFLLNWTESGGPPVKRPARKGFGSTVIVRGLSLELDGEVEVDFDPHGLVCTMKIPFAAARKGG